MIPDYQTLMLPSPECAATGATRICDAVEQLAQKFGLTPNERAQLVRLGNPPALRVASSRESGKYK